MKQGVKDQVTAAVKEAIAAAGGDPAAVKGADIVKRFIGVEGASRSALYRLVGALLAEAAGKPRLMPVPKIVASAKPPVFRPEIEVPPPAGFDKLVGPAGIGVVEALQQCVRAALDVMQHSRHPDGKVRLGKTLVSASDHLRRTLETAARVHETFVGIEKINLFYEALMSAVEEASPEVRFKVMSYIDAVNARWRGSVDGPRSEEKT